MQRYCAQPGCPTLVPRGYCLAHRVAHRAAPWALRQAAPKLRGYGNDWKRLRQWFMRQPGNQLCRLCEQRGTLVLATDCDHIVPFHGLHDRKRLDPTNLQPLCHQCHQQKTAAGG